VNIRVSGAAQAIRSDNLCARSLAPLVKARGEG
jgi:hypothetical protein